MQCANLLRQCHALSLPLADALGGMPEAGRPEAPSPWAGHPGPAIDDADLGQADAGLYCLARVDESTGAPLRLATDKEAEELGRILELSGNGHLLTCPEGEGGPLAGQRSGGLSGRGSWRGGGPCDHCGATESPQWRRGPPMKSVLCNACGTRYRRTGQLGPPGPATSMRKTRSVMSDQKRYNVGGKEGSRLVFCEAA
ncbi:unnamed protein product [Ostreobium quekettii]|uniref:GATA-type domain-containing protein n=1 Tax=Ostreobium quekettii TaxID=121088 RepID=A0A8S1IL88_9CHLO|nr:unnamed protein product [Ostreobium quekettii]|eukprot:evm.model.scf_461.6 EVM.evm.TU.scf_461.6   scf_461:39636-41765(+)